MKTSKQFPRQFRSSSAGYRAIYQYEDKNGMERGGSGLVLTKLSDKVFYVGESKKLTMSEFKDKVKKVVYPELSYKYFPDGVQGEGFYELKTGDRRRPNSLFLSVDKVYDDFTNEVCK